MSVKCTIKTVVGIITIVFLHACDKDDDRIIDADGNVYSSVTIGTQVWMVENLKTTKYNDGSEIRFVTDDAEWLNSNTGAYCWYNNTSTNKDIYGALYNWYVIDNNPASKINSNGGKNVCPVGWHVPSQTEWIRMETYLMANGYNYDGNVDNYNKIAKSLASSTGWTLSTITGAVGNSDYPLVRNETGFTALPGGKRNLGFPETFVDLGAGGYWWIVTEIQNEGVGFYMYFDSPSPNLFYTNKEVGFSVRCIRD
jgi:uncharacterized protein (TIGR02145 family)